MRFTERFSSFASLGDTIEIGIDGFTITARIEHDDCPDPPDERQDGFWPSLDPNDPGFIGPGNKFRERFEKAQSRAESIMEDWREGAWFYGGIILAVSIDDIVIEPHAASLWGVEVNFPGTDENYLKEIADQLLPEALDAARAARDQLARRLEETAS